MEVSCCKTAAFSILFRSTWASGSEQLGSSAYPNGSDRPPLDERNAEVLAVAATGAAGGQSAAVGSLAHRAASGLLVAEVYSLSVAWSVPLASATVPIRDVSEWGVDVTGHA
jgi:hypothetical protein